MKIFVIIFTFLLFGCVLHDLEEPNAIVPATTDQNHLLSQITITVKGFSRSIHLKTFGDPVNPPVFVLHGGPGGDFKLMLPLMALADRYFVVMWDSRGAGLSERVTKDELTIDSFLDEVAQVKAAFSPNRRVILIGHSFGGNVMARYTANNPQEVSQLILIEPGKLDNSIKETHNGGAVSFMDGQNFFWQNEILTSSDHAAADYKAIDMLPKSARNWTCDKSIATNYPFWRFGAYHYYVVQLNSFKLPKNFNWATNIENYSGNISLVAGSCGALGERFQLKTNMKTLPNASFHTIENAGHISLFTDFSEKTVDLLKNILK
jgi:proline iminopeptidase